MSGRAVRDHIEVPALEQGQGLFEVKTMEFAARAGFEGQGAGFEDVIQRIAQFCLYSFNIDR